MGAVVEPDLRTTLAAAPLVRDVVVARGEEAGAYLQGQLSQDLDALAVGATRPALLLQPTGKLVAWLRVTRAAEDELLLDVDAGAGEVVLQRLRRFLLRTKATLEVAPWSGFAVRGPGAAEAAARFAGEGHRALAAGWPGIDGVDVLAPSGVAVPEPDLPSAGHGALEAARVESGVPAFGAEITDATIPAELGQWLVDASVSFTKGCYAGQELVARIDSRGGNVPRPLRGLLVEGAEAPVPGTAILAGEDEVGTVTSGAVSTALGPIALGPLARSVPVGAPVRLRPGAGAAPERAATVAELPLR